MNGYKITEEAPAPHRDPNENRYVPIPANGKVCSVTGLKHAHLYRLLLQGEAANHVRVVNLKDPGASRGKTLFHAGDFLRWLDGLAATQKASRGG